MKKKKVAVEFDGVIEASPVDAKALIDVLEREMHREKDDYQRRQIRDRLYPLVSAYAEALSSGKAEDVALVHLQATEKRAETEVARVALEKFKVRSIHWTIRFALAVAAGAVWLVLA